MANKLMKGSSIALAIGKMKTHWSTIVHLLKLLKNKKNNIMSGG
jgi:hypothetical protein